MAVAYYSLCVVIFCFTAFVIVCLSAFSIIVNLQQCLDETVECYYDNNGTFSIELFVVEVINLTTPLIIIEGIFVSLLTNSIFLVVLIWICIYKNVKSKKEGHNYKKIT